VLSFAGVRRLRALGLWSLARMPFRVWTAVLLRPCCLRIACLRVHNLAGASCNRSFLYPALALEGHVE